MMWVGLIGVRFPLEVTASVRQDGAVAQTSVADPQRCYRAVSSRDPRFDGVFYVAVTSTGIYCRPSCPARTPLPENTRFYVTAAAAQDAGFRAGQLGRQ